MARLKNVGEPVHVYAPPGGAHSLFVDAGQIVEVPGEITGEVADAYLIGAGDDVRAWPKGQWSATSKAGHDNPEAPAAAPAAD